jgi:hypothetical protein
MPVRYLLLFYSLPAFATDIPCPSPSSSLSPLIQMAQELGEASLELAAKDLKNFCEWNRMGRAAQGPGIRDRFMTAARAGDKAAAVRLIQKHIHEIADSPWEFSMLGEASLKSGAAEASFLWNDEGDTPRKASFDDVARAFAEPFDPAEEPYAVPDVYDEGEIEISLTERLAACAYLSPLESLSCSSALARVAEVMAPAWMGEGQVTAIGAFQNAATNPKLTEGLRLAVLALHSRWKEGKVSPDANLFEDIHGAFLSSGLSASEAEDAAWDTLAALSVGGPNMAVRFDTLYLSMIGSNPNAFALSALGEMIPFLDSQKMRGEPPAVYSLPAGYSFPCDSGKTYHFWMAAYLARRLGREGYAEGASRAAIYASNVGYQAMGRSAGVTSLLKVPSLSPTDVGIRIDLNLAAAGARFGSRRPKAGDKFSVGRAFQQSLRDGSKGKSVAEILAGDRRAQMLNWAQRYDVGGIYRRSWE